MISKFQRNLSVFQSCDAEYDESDVVIFSSPMDATCSFRPGTRFAGPAIRQDSIGMEWYSPYMEMDLKDYKTCDIGDLELPMGDVEKDLDEISRVTREILNDNKKTMMIGGEHLVTYGTIREYVKKYPEKCYEMLKSGTLYQFGIRSGDKEEFEWAKTHIHQRKFDLVGLDKCVEELKDKPVYITIDLDVLDPSIFPGTGTPEASGVTFKELEDAILTMRGLNNIVGADMVELSPDYDSSHVSTQVACKVLRELTLLLHH